MNRTFGDWRENPVSETSCSEIKTGRWIMSRNIIFLLVCLIAALNGSLFYPEDDRVSSEDFRNIHEFLPDYKESRPRR
jgi:hypothetical protein